jgi:NAD(P)-dependent dehydrogenase (short-subunit alcohol dehydrogenase family)
MQLDLGGKVALVTGAATGIGKACADILAESGARVIYSDRDLDRVTETARGKGEPLSLDVAVRPGVEAAVEQALTRFGQIDILVNNAGIGVKAEDRSTIEEFPEEAWDEVLAIDLTGLFLVSRAVIKGHEGAADRGGGQHRLDHGDRAPADAKPLHRGQGGGHQPDARDGDRAGH